MMQGEAKRTGDASEVLRAPRRRGGEMWLVAALCLLVGAFQLWTERSTDEPWHFGREQNDYYNLLLDGWLSGQLHMKVDVPEALLKLEDPYDPSKRPPSLGLHDASFYRGKYYVYFGAAPVVLLMLPFRLLTGVDLPQAVAVLTFVYGGFLASVGVLVAMRRRYYPETSLWVVSAAVLTLGVVSLGPLLLRRPHMWELPISAGYCFGMLTLAAVWRSVHATERQGRLRALAASSAFLGFAIASRPTYLFAMPALLVPLFVWWRAKRCLPWRELAAVVVPLAVVGAAMAGHNYARFGNPLQFGQAYQLSMDYESKLPHFQAAYVPYNIGRHFFGRAEWSRYFPFIQPEMLPPSPEGYTRHRGDVYGVLANMPIAWLAFCAPLALWRRNGEQRRILGTWITVAAVGSSRVDLQACKLEYSIVSPK